jgi:receptor protein-tyrosine kinase
MQELKLTTILWRGKWLIALAFAVGIALAVVVTAHTAKVYRATALIQVNSAAAFANANAQSPSDVQLANQGLASTYATLIDDRGFLQQVQPHVLGGRLSTSELQDRVSAKPLENTSLVELEADAESPARARALASDLAAAFTGVVQERAQARWQQQQDAIQKRLSELGTQIRRLALRRQTPVVAEQLDSLRGARSQLQAQLANGIATGVQQAEGASVPAPATASSSPVKPSPLLNLVAGALLGLLAGVGLSWLRLRLDRGLHSSHEAEELLGVPVLAAIPVRRRYASDDPVLGEAFDVLRANLAFISLDRPLQVVTVSSFNPREGKSSTVEGLAFAAARAGMSVALVDADVRTRTLSQRLERDGTLGLTGVVLGAYELDEALVELAPGVSLLPSGPTPPNPPSLLGSDRARDVLRELRSRFDLVLVDSPPVAHLADAAILAADSDGVVVVARVGVTDRADLLELAASLRHSPTPIVGSVLLERRTIDQTYYPAVSAGMTPTAKAAEPA